MSPRWVDKECVVQNCSTVDERASSLRRSSSCEWGRRRKEGHATPVGKGEGKAGGSLGLDNKQRHSLLSQGWVQESSQVRHTEMPCGAHDDVVSRSGARACAFEGSGKENRPDISKVCYLRCPKTTDDFNIRDRTSSRKLQAWDAPTCQDLLQVRNFCLRSTLRGYFGVRICRACVLASPGLARSRLWPLVPPQHH